MAKVLFEVDYDLTPIRHLYVTCPGCNFKLEASDFFGRHISYMYQIFGETVHCPVCGQEYTFLSVAGKDEAVIKEVSYPKCAEGAKTRKVVWE